MRQVLIVGTGLIGASVGLALRAAGFDGEIIGTGPTAETLTIARDIGAIDSFHARDGADSVAANCDVIVLCGPVLSILDWMHRLAPLLGEHTKEVLRKTLGYDDARIAALAEAGAFGMVATVEVS